jgi:hypothetical protein
MEWESSIATFTYPDNWKISGIIGNGKGIILIPIDEQNVATSRTVYQDLDYKFVELVEEMRQITTRNGFQIDEIMINVPGEYKFSTYGFNNGIDWKGYVRILQVPNTNDVACEQYIAESSKYQQYNDPTGFSVYTKLSDQERKSLEEARKNPLPSYDGPNWQWNWKWGPGGLQGPTLELT